MEKDERRRKISNSAASGAVAIIFLIIGFQSAIFVEKVLHRPVQTGGELSEKVSPLAPPADSASRGNCRELEERRSPYPGRQGALVSLRRERPGNGGAVPRRASRRAETFSFDPNTVSVEELVRLGLSERQAESIERYRSRGGRFRQPEDFRKMYVVTDSLFERLKDSIVIPRLELNSADSAALTSLRGIGPWFASRIVAYRQALGGFYSISQLLEIRNMDSVRLEGFSSGLCVDTSLVKRFSLYEMPEEALSAHPYIGRSAARSICRYRSVGGLDSLSADILVRENIIEEKTAEKLKHYLK